MVVAPCLAESSLFFPVLSGLVPLDPATDKSGQHPPYLLLTTTQSRCVNQWYHITEAHLASLSICICTVELCQGWLCCVAIACISPLATQINASPTQRTHRRKMQVGKLRRRKMCHIPFCVSVSSAHSPHFADNSSPQMKATNAKDARASP